MLPDRLNKDNKFDEMLGRTLRSSSQSVPADFTQKMLRQIRQAEEQRILARVVLQERLALAGCILFAVVAIIVLAAFPDTITAIYSSIVGSFTTGSSELVSRSLESIVTVWNHWQLCIALVAMAGFAIYSLIDLLTSDRLKTA